MRRVLKTKSCWLWQGTTGGSKSTYGYFREGTRERDPKKMAHRWLYEQIRGPIPEGLQLDHKCRMPLCVNPDHLEPVTPAENAARTRLKICKAGLHDLTDPRNQQWDAQGRRRGCRPCQGRRM